MRVGEEHHRPPGNRLAGKSCFLTHPYQVLGEIRQYQLIPRTPIKSLGSSTRGARHCRYINGAFLVTNGTH